MLESIAIGFSATPTRKRKRESGASYPPKDAAGTASSTACSSTPKRLIGKRRIPQSTTKLTQTKENTNTFQHHSYLEVKSIADLVNKCGQIQKKNPYEVIRKPPKKKKRQSDHPIACFENPALNLELPEKQFNPYEVVRETLRGPSTSKCFVNEALNIRGNDAPSTLNPFEIQRHRDDALNIVTMNSSGIENLGMDAGEVITPTVLKIGLPFMPTIGCRIDFNGLPLSQLTPSKMFAEKLVFSPVPAPRRKSSLSAISEETTMDIGKELDRYQLELENSINEAKLRKGGAEQHSPSLANVKERVVVTTAPPVLSGIEEAAEEFEEKTHELQPKTIQVASNKTESDTMTSVGNLETNSAKTNQSDNVAVASESDNDDECDEIDFKAPTRFVRAYRPAEIVASVKITKRTSKESLNNINSNEVKSQSATASLNVKDLMRNSIRKLIHPHKVPVVASTETETTPKSSNNIMSSIRRSLRRKINKESTKQNDYEGFDKLPDIADISIIDTSERTLKLKSTQVENEYIQIGQLTNEKKYSLRGSIRRSTRDMLRTVFHKNHEGYAFQK